MPIRTVCVGMPCVCLFTCICCNVQPGYKRVLLEGICEHMLGIDDGVEHEDNVLRGFSRRVAVAFRRQEDHVVQHRES